MLLSPRILFVFVIVCANLARHEGKILKFTKLECKDHDKSFVSFQQCHLKAIGRNRIAMQLHANLHQTIHDNLTVNAELFRKSHDFRPFMYNDTIDFCGFIRNPNRFMFWKVLFQDMTKFSNINHTCPYEHDLIIKDIILDDSMMKTLPFPSNDYMIHVKALVKDDVKAEIKIYVVIVE